MSAAVNDVSMEFAQQEPEAPVPCAEPQAETCSDSSSEPGDDSEPPKDDGSIDEDTGPSGAPSATETLTADKPVLKDGPSLTWPDIWGQLKVKYGTPSLKVICERLVAYQKTHKNALPDPYNFALLIGDLLTAPPESADYATIHLVMLGKRNGEGKLDQAGQKYSMRQQYKSQSALRVDGPRRNFCDQPFKIFADKSYTDVDEALVVALRAHVKRLVYEAGTKDKGHFPHAMVERAKGELSRAENASADRIKRIHEGEAAKARREASKEQLAIKRAREKADKQASDNASGAKKSRNEAAKNYEAIRAEVQAEYALRLQSDLATFVNGGGDALEFFKQLREKSATV